MLLLAFNSSAALINTDLTEDDFISYQGIDWAWASPVNIQIWGSNENELMLPEFHSGWRFATLNELNILKTDLGLAAFMRLDGSYIQAVRYWNTTFTHVDSGDFFSGYISSQWGSGSYETFYVRESIPVPEPTTLLIFAMGLIGLGLRKRTF